MENRIKTAIQKVTLNEHTFSGEVFEPTLINFFFGNNGTGKSTIAKNIGLPHATEWASGASPDDYDLLVYNEEFIRENIQSYGSLPGVFTITKQNATIKAGIDKKTAERATLLARVKTLMDTITEEQDKQQCVDVAYEKSIWDATKIIRKDKYSASQTGYTTDKKKFIAHLETISPVDVDETVLAQLYTIATGPDIPPYDEYKSIDPATIPTSPLLQKSIIGSSHTAFGDFVHALNASGWVSQGHSTYQHAAGDKCPYCQQTLPDSFEANLASCFDEQYQQSVAELERFLQAYRDAMNNIYLLLEANTKNRFKTDLSAEYKAKCDLFKERGLANVEILKQKLADPERAVALQDLTDVFNELNELIAHINESIKTDNEVINDKPTKKQECFSMVWQFMASKCQADIAVHKSEKERHESDIAKLAKERDKAKEDAERLLSEIGGLNKQTVNTTAAKDSINALLTAAGFQGFRLREKPGTQYVYELIRDEDGKIAKGLSEGERNFIAFLYFYHMVIGSQSDDGKATNKIVVIDDPVSSMDSSSMFTVASLVRDLIAICYNNYRMTDDGDKHDFIKQLFCLTHNPFFFKEISYNRITENECVNIYELKKEAHNQSFIKWCTHPDELVGSGLVNYSPVKNTYDSLWVEYRTATDSVALMNVTRRILEYYFLQICGYSGSDLRADLLERHRADFETTRPDGSIDSANYNVASGMLAILNVGVREFNDGLFFDASAVEPAQLRDVFQKIFTATAQNQHYSMMMNQQQGE